MLAVLASPSVISQPVSEVEGRMCQNLLLIELQNTRMFECLGL